MITKEKIQEQYLKEKKFSYMNPIVADIDYVKWLETELINAKKQLPINGVVKSLNFLDTSETKQKRSYYVDKQGRYIHESGKQIKGQELKILKELEAEGKI